MSSQPKVSVIIPVYNMEKYLRECLDSVVNQTLKDIEIICVDDGSTDGSLAILEENRKRDARITVISQENRGLSAARNAGMLHATGEYLYFIDSDDWLDTDALEKLYPLAAEDNLDALLFGIKEFYSSAELHQAFPFFEFWYDKKKLSGFYSGIEYIKEAKDQREYLANVYRALWKRALFRDNQIRFKRGIIHEDNLFTFQALMTADKVRIIPDKFYHRRVREHSTMTAPKSAKNVIGYFSCAEGVLEYLSSGPFSHDREHEIQREYVRMINAARHDYAVIPPEEQARVVFPREVENELFRQTVVSGHELAAAGDELKRTRKELAAAGDELKRTREELKRSRKNEDALRRNLGDVHNSVSFRIGRAITWLPRNIRGAVRSFGKR